MPDVSALAARGNTLAPLRPRAPGSRHEAVASLLDGTCRLTDLRAVAVALGMPVAGRYRILSLAGGGPAHRAAARAALSGSGRAVHWHASRPVEHAIVLLENAGRDAAAPAGAPKDRLPAGVRIGIGLAVDGLVALAEGRRQAQTALALCPPDGGVVDLASQLPIALLSADPGLADQLCAQVLGPLAQVEDDEREMLLQTFESWLANDGSARDAARLLGCHRNTVTNRLRRLERLTGRSIDRPGDVVDLTLALRAHRLTAGGRGRTGDGGTDSAGSDPAGRVAQHEAHHVARGALQLAQGDAVGSRQGVQE